MHTSAGSMGTHELDWWFNENLWNVNGILWDLYGFMVMSEHSTNMTGHSWDDVPPEVEVFFRWEKHPFIGCPCPGTCMEIWLKIQLSMGKSIPETRRFLMSQISSPWCWNIGQHKNPIFMAQCHVGKYSSTMVRINGIYLPYIYHIFTIYSPYIYHIFTICLFI